MIAGQLTLRKVQTEVRRIMKLAMEPATHWEAENAERDLVDEFVRWCATSKAANDPREVKEIAGWIARLFDLNFMRNYATEDTNG